MKTNHTPGPWKLIGSRDSGFTVHASLPDDAGDTDILAVCRNISRDTNEANARLISAAPELLQALETFIGIYPLASRMHPDVAIALSQANAALALAKGETKP